MECWKFCIVVALALSCASVLGQEMPPPETIKLNDSKVAPTRGPHTTTMAPETTSAPKTTSPAPKTTTPSPETTTPAPKTTTPPPKTTTPPPKTTTPPPQTTTPAPPPPPPAPMPAPTTGLWNYTDSSTNITCIVVQFAVQFNVSYAAGKDTLNATFNLPADSVPTGGSCGNTSQLITLSWPKDEPLSNQNNFTLNYQLNSTSHQYYVQQVSVALFYNSELFPNATSQTNMEFHNKGEEWATGVSYSYRCKHPQSLKLTAEPEGTAGNAVAEITLSDLQEEAFRSVKGHQFSIAADCEPGDVPDVVPIAVGCALGGLVLVVLAAYLVGRRRSQARGYLSM